MVERRNSIPVRSVEIISPGRRFQVITDCRRHLRLFRDLGLLLLMAVVTSILVGDILISGQSAQAVPFWPGRPPTIMLGVRMRNINILKNTNGVSVAKSTLNVRTNVTNGYNVTLSGRTTLANALGSTIPTTTATSSHPLPLPVNSWGVALPGETGFSTQSDYESADPLTLRSTKYIGVPTAGQEVTVMSATAPTDVNGDDRAVYYGVNIPDITKIQAGEYKTTLTYTATAKIPPAPILQSITPDNFEIDSDSVKTVSLTLRGSNLTTVMDVFLDINGDGKRSNGDQSCINPTAKSDTEVVCQIQGTYYSYVKSGKYDVYITTQGGITKLEKAFVLSRQSFCRNGEAYSDCRVDLDEGMIPIVYRDGTATDPHWYTLTKDQIARNRGSWYSYTQYIAGRKWANAVTVKPDKLAKYKDKSVLLDNNDVLGYWVYIPRYAYEVQRRDATDRYVPMQNFKIRFEKSTDLKKRPAPSCNAGIKTAAQMWRDGNPGNMADANVLAKDYRSGCNTELTYYEADPAMANRTAWATHPAFSYDGKELNGIWVGKFETTGKRTAPTIKPNQKSNISEPIGNFFTMAKSMGVNDPANTSGTAIPGIVQNSHGLTSATTHLLKSSEWGAIAYLTTSKYGIGVNGVKSNLALVGTNGTDRDGQAGDVGVTGCGTVWTGSTAAYTGATLDTVTTESNKACKDEVNLYSGTVGSKASTDGSPSGVFDLAGGAHEIVAGKISTGSDSSSEPYINLYRTSQGFGTKPAWSASNNATWYNYDVCTWETCGGQALYEVQSTMSVTGDSQSWGGAVSNFAFASSPWTVYGGSARFGTRASIFASETNNGSDALKSITMRATLTVLPK